MYFAVVRGRGGAGGAPWLTLDPTKKYTMSHRGMGLRSESQGVPLPTGVVLLGAGAGGLQDSGGALPDPSFLSHSRHPLSPNTQARVQVRAVGGPIPVVLLFLRNGVFTPHSSSLAPVTVGATWTTLTITDVVLPALAEYHVQVRLSTVFL